MLIYGNAASNRDALLPFIIEKVNDYGVLKRLQRMFADNQSYASEIKIGEKFPGCAMFIRKKNYLAQKSRGTSKCYGFLLFEAEFLNLVNKFITKYLPY